MEIKLEQDTPDEIRQAAERTGFEFGDLEFSVEYLRAFNKPLTMATAEELNELEYQVDDASSAEEIAVFVFAYWTLIQEEKERRRRQPLSLVQ